MNQPTKKILAKEILIFSGIVTISLCVFLGIYLINYYQTSKIKKIENKITEQKKELDSLQNTYISKVHNQLQYFTEMKKEYNLDKYSTPTSLWQRLDELVQKDSLKIKYDLNTKEFKGYHEKLGFQGSAGFEDFVKANILTTSEKKNIIKVFQIVEIMGYKPHFDPSLHFEELFEESNLGKLVGKYTYQDRLLKAKEIPSFEEVMKSKDIIINLDRIWPDKYDNLFFPSLSDQAIESIKQNVLSKSEQVHRSEE